MKLRVNSTVTVQKKVFVYQQKRTRLSSLVIRRYFMFQFQFKDRLLTKNQLLADTDYQATSASAMAIGFDPNNPNIVYVFASEADFINWSKGTPHASDVAKAVASMSALRQRGEADRDQIMARFNENNQRIETEMEKLSTQMNLPWPSEELFRKGHELGIIHSLLLFDPTWYSPPFRMFEESAMPDFRWINFDKVTSSLYVSGVGALYDNYWFSGRVLWLAGVPFWGIPDLSNSNFNNVASSGWVAGGM